MTLSLKLDTASPNFLFFDSNEGFILQNGATSLRVTREDADKLARYIDEKNSAWRADQVNDEIERLTGVR